MFACQCVCVRVCGTARVCVCVCACVLAHCYVVPAAFGKEQHESQFHGFFMFESFGVVTGMSHDADYNNIVPYNITIDYRF